MLHLRWPFRRLRWKLTLSYTLVTVGALLVVELAAVAALQWFINSDTLPRMIAISLQQALPSQARPFLEKDPPDLLGLKAWLNAISSQNQDLQSLFNQAEQCLVLGPSGQFVAARLEPNQPFEASQVPGLAPILPAALAGQTDPARLFTRAPDGTMTFALPVVSQGGKVLGVIVLSIRMDIYGQAGWSNLLRGVGISALIFTCAAGGIGTLFGFFTAYGLTRRLKRMTEAALAWGQGDFSAAIGDASADEIGQLAAKLNQMSQQLQAWTQTRQRLAASEERNRLARDLHDSVKQQVFAISMNLGAAKTLWERDPAAAHARLDAASTLSRQAQQELGALIQTLRPAPLEGKALRAALPELVRQWEAQSGLPAACQVTSQASLPEEIEQALFRVAQEALANIAKHSGAQKASVTLDVQPGMATLQIADDGHGFDSAQAEPGLGLRSMRERVQALGGRLEILSDAQGTRLTAQISLPPSSEAKP